MIDRAVNTVADLVEGGGAILRRLQTGLVQHYILAVALGIFLIASLYLIFQ